MKKRITFLLAGICCLSGIFATKVKAQCSVIHIPGSDKIVTAKGSGPYGTPSLFYTASAGTQRAVLFVATFERDHTLTTDCSPQGRGNNFASAGLKSATAPTGNSVAISATWGGQPLILVSHVSSFVGTSITSTNNTGTQISEETYTFILLESNIPASGGPFVLGGDFQSPQNPGDEAVITAATYDYVGTYENITGANAAFGINSLSITANTASPSHQPPNTTGANNMIVTAMVFDKEGETITASPGSIINDISVSNSGGTYATNKCIVGSNYTENDGIHVATLLTTGEGNQSIVSSISGDSVILSQIKPIRLVYGSGTSSSGCALPITLSDFSAQKQGNNAVVLNWTTATELNNSYFSIEHSTNGTFWTAIGKVESKAVNGNSNEALSYTYTDATTSPGINYYRLKQVDLSGKAAYSEVKSVAGMQTVLSNLKLYPNPTNNYINISGLKGNEKIMVVNTTGRLLLTKQASNSTERINITRWAAGVYYVSIMDTTHQIKKLQFIKN